jgi:iron complex outermembrane receptor protein
MNPNSKDPRGTRIFTGVNHNPASLAKATRSPAHKLITTLILGISLVCCAIASLAAPTDIYHLTISAQPADQALTKLGRSTKKSLIFNYDVVSQYTSNKLDGNYPIDEALRLLLEGTPLRFEIDQGYIIIAVQPSPALPPAITPAPEQQAPDSLARDYVEEVFITGYLGSIKRALIKKRFSDFIVDGVSSEDLGKYPDQNVAEALQRIPGVSIDKNGGEGQFITVRGFGPEFNTVLYNGRVLATENQGREFSFDVLAAELISGAEAHKTPTASTIVGGIGSTINLITANPIDHFGLRSTYHLKQTYDTLSEQSFPHYSGLMSYANEKFGAMVSVNYQQREYQIDNVTTNGWRLADLSYVPEKSGPGDFSAVRIPRNIDFKRDQGKRERIGGSIILQLQPRPNLLFTADFLYSKYTVDSNITAAANWTHDWGETMQSAHVDEHNTLLAYQYKSDWNLATDFAQITRNRPTETTQLGLNSRWSINNSVDLTMDFSYSLAENTNGGKEQFVVVGRPNANPHYKLLPGANYPSIAYDRPGNLSNLKSHVIVFEGDTVQDFVWQQKMDLAIEVDKGIIHSTNLGVLLSERNKSKDAYKTPWGREFSGYQFDIPTHFFNAMDASDFLQGGVPPVWYQFDAQEIATFLWSDEQLQKNIKDTNHPLADTIDARKAMGGVAPAYEPVNSWEISETPLEFYVQINLGGHFGDMPWSGNIGLRHADTHVISRGNEQAILAIEAEQNDPTNLKLTLDNARPVAVSHRYNNNLPAANFKLNLTKEQLLQLGLSKTITRPTFHRLTPAMGNFNGRLGASQASAGNPYLAPYESKNLDFSWSWYYGKSHFLGANAFVKYIDQFVSLRTQNEAIFAPPYGTFLVTRPQNTSSSRVSGIEFAFLHSFDSGFGLQANYTYVGSRDEFNPDNPGKKFLLEGLSDNYNLIAFYDRGRFQAQLAYNFREQFLRAAAGLQSQPEMVVDYGQIDFSASFDITSNIELFVEGVNITNQKKRVFSIYKERLLDYAESGARFSLGIRGTY